MATTRAGLPEAPQAGLGGILKPLSRIGPAFITMSLTFGPASLLLAGTAGALYRYRLMWVLPLILLMRIVFYDLGVRVGINIPHNIWTTVGRSYGFWLGALTGTIAFLSAAFYASGNVLGTAMAIQLFVPGAGLVVLGVLTIAAAVLMFSFRGIYERLEKVAMVMVAVMLVSFIGTLIATGWSAGEFVRGLWPHSPTAPELLLALAIFATNYGGAGQSHTYFVRAKKYTAKEARAAFADHVISSVLMAIIIGAIMSVGAETLNVAHEVPANAPQFARMLAPLAGTGATYLFAVGLFGAAFTSLVGHPIGTGIGLADGWQRADLNTESPFMRWTAIILVLVMGLWGVVPVALGFPMLNIYWICSLATLLAMPLGGVLMLVIAGRKDIMKQLPISQIHYILLWALFIAMVCYTFYSGSKTVINLLR